MRWHRFINNLLYLIIQQVGKESKAKENNRVFWFFVILFIDRRLIAQVIHFNLHLQNPLALCQETWFLSCGRYMLAVECACYQGVHGQAL